MLADACPICWRITAAETLASSQRRMQPRRNGPLLNEALRKLRHSSRPTIVWPQDDGAKAIGELNGMDVDGRAVMVNEARPQEGRGGGNRGGYGGRDGGRGGRGGRGGGRRGY
jgi:hypothetical protein